MSVWMLTNVILVESPPAHLATHVATKSGAMNVSMSTNVAWRKKFAAKGTDVSTLWGRTNVLTLMNV